MPVEEYLQERINNALDFTKLWINEYDVKTFRIKFSRKNMSFIVRSPIQGSWQTIKIVEVFQSPHSSGGIHKS